MEDSCYAALIKEELTLKKDFIDFKKRTFRLLMIIGTISLFIIGFVSAIEPMNPLKVVSISLLTCSIYFTLVSYITETMPLIREVERLERTLEALEKK